MSKFLAYRQSVLSLFDATIAFARKYDFAAGLEGILAGRERVEKNSLVVLACGEAKRGKSSMLCALLGDKDLFPVDVEITTCITTSVRYGPTEQITVVLEDASGKEERKNITRAQIPQYVMEQHNPGNYKRAKYLLIETPIDKLKNGLVFIDTPGVGSLNPEHSLATYEMLPRADVVLFVSDTASPLSETELSFLNRVQKHCGNFLFVLTKKDLRRVDENEAMIAENKAKIQQFAGMDAEAIRYVPVSSTMKLAHLDKPNPRFDKSSNFQALEREFWDMIFRNRADIIMAPALGVLGEGLEAIEDEINIRFTGVSGSAQEQETLRHRLQEISRQRQELINNSPLWQREISSEIAIIEKQARDCIRDFRDTAITKTRKCIKEKRYVKDPHLLLNEIVCLAVNASDDMNSLMYLGLDAINAAFENRVNGPLNENIAQAPILAREGNDVVFEKQKLLDSVVSKGRKIGLNSLGMGGFLGACGAVIGGVVGGLMTMNPAGVVLGVKAGLAWGSSVGAGLGTAKGAIDVAVRVDDTDAGNVQSAIIDYINKVVADWQHALPAYMRTVSQDFLTSLQSNLRKNKEKAERGIAELKTNIALGTEARAAENDRLMKARNTYNRVLARLATLRDARVYDDSFEVAYDAPANAAVEPEGWPEPPAQPKLPVQPEAPAQPEPPARPEATTAGLYGLDD